MRTVKVSLPSAWVFYKQRRKLKLPWSHDNDDEYYELEVNNRKFVTGHKRHSELIASHTGRMVRISTCSSTLTFTLQRPKAACNVVGTMLFRQKLPLNSSSTSNDLGEFKGQMKWKYNYFHCVKGQEIKKAMEFLRWVKASQSGKAEVTVSLLVGFFTFTNSVLFI